MLLLSLVSDLIGLFQLTDELSKNPKHKKQREKYSQKFPDMLELHIQNSKSNSG